MWETSILIGQYNIEAGAYWLCDSVGGAYSDRVRMLYARWSRAAPDIARKTNCRCVLWLNCPVIVFFFTFKGALQRPPRHEDTF